MGDVTTAEARRNLAEILNRVAYGKERVLVTRHGKGLAAIVPVDDLRLLDRIRNFADGKDAETALDEMERGGSIAWTALKAELGL
jgi:prevent-host-death family protein